MAFTGFHVTCGRGGGVGPSVRETYFLPLLSRAVWSETMTSPGTTTNVGMLDTIAEGEPFFSVRSSVDAWVAIGPTPNASTGPRRFLPANTDMDLAGKQGDKVAWIAA